MHKFYNIKVELLIECSTKEITHQTCLDLVCENFLHLIVIKLRQFLSLGNSSGLYQDNNYFDFYKWRGDLFCRKRLLFTQMVGCALSCVMGLNWSGWYQDTRGFKRPIKLRVCFCEICWDLFAAVNTLPRLSCKFIKQNNFTSCVMVVAANSIFISKVTEQGTPVQADCRRPSVSG